MIQLNEGQLEERIYQFELTKMQSWAEAGHSVLSAYIGILAAVLVAFMSLDLNNPLLEITVALKI